MAENFSKGQAGKCRFPATIRNLSRYHVNKITYKVRDWSLREQEINSNKSRTYDTLKELAPWADARLCADEAALLLERIAMAEVNDCAMDGLAEGDCQTMVHISAKFGAAEVEAIRQQEAEAQKKYAEDVEGARLKKEADERATRLKKKAGERAAVAKERAIEEQRRKTAARDRIYWNKIMEVFAISRNEQILAVMPVRLTQAISFHVDEENQSQANSSMKPCIILELRTKSAIESLVRRKRCAECGEATLVLVERFFTAQINAPKEYFSIGQIQTNWKIPAGTGLYAKKNDLIPIGIYSSHVSCRFEEGGSFSIDLSTKRLAKGELPSGPMPAEAAKLFGDDITSIQW